ncbi:MAG: FAD-dependent oxidoreductase [Cyanobacteria bacterium J06638_6]
MEDVVVIGAGSSGLTAARQLLQRGYRVQVIDKSRGLGGRLATRRRGSVAIDHGCRYLTPFIDESLSPIAQLLNAGVLHPWQPDAFTLGAGGSLTAAQPKTLYRAPQGMSSIAKALAANLTIQRSWRATALTPLTQGWRITGETATADSQTISQVLEAKAVVLAIPAPQAAVLLETAAQQDDAIDAVVQQLQAVTFDAVITVMAGYTPTQPTQLDGQTGVNGWMVDGSEPSPLRWVALDSSKRTEPQEPIVVLHSSATFAAKAIEHPDLHAVSRELLLKAAQNLAPWLNEPAWMQVHRWRYGFVSQSLDKPLLHHPDLPNLVGCGDWCHGGNLEGAIASGHRSAAALAQVLEAR